MKAARIHAYGHSDQIQLEDITIPSPGPDEVLVRISAAGVNPIDWKLREGFMPGARRLPFTLGQDFAGDVIAVGSNVAMFTASDDVYGFADGAYAQYAVTTPDMISTKPLTVHDAIAASLPTPGLTAMQIVAELERDGQHPRDVLIHGAAGAVGSIAVQLCIAHGMRVTATAAAKDFAYLKQLGVARVIDYKRERFEAAVSGIGAVIDVIGGDTLARSFAVMARGATIVSTVGAIDQAVAASHGVRGIRIVMRKNAADLGELAALVDRGVIKPHALRLMPLAAARQAQDLKQAGTSSELLVLDAS
ncbi:MAG TPA: NADP-dependent oxidoreductase [Kofleriaceae bacterium]|nr:NADP-dependent oxidoreductase [Kofleriaceae bacterium]